ncbi:hypothetical protein CTRI78_v001797 [Colletotrichum trifolii]|uniref:Uncharacterized protein n=1 Tax=Colletotrichum trifolii TaxID=5466 RepID=A0A4R8RP09_COLTR|nr:hypothetical protein CTRI78_v001797 [Colletotrichum trifolii]
MASRRKNNTPRPRRECEFDSCPGPISSGPNAGIRMHIKDKHGGVKTLSCHTIMKQREGWLENHILTCDVCRPNFQNFAAPAAQPQEEIAQNIEVEGLTANVIILNNTNFTIIRTNFFH